MYHRVLILIVCLLLAGCGTTPTSVELAVPPVAVSPATVHQQFIAALQQNDRPAVVVLVSDHVPDGLIDKWLSDATALQRTSPFTGKFTEVRVLPPTEQGQGHTAISRWQHETGAECYRANLAQTETTWRVSSWDFMGLGKCPSS